MADARYIQHSNNLPSDLQKVRDDLTDALAAGVRRVHRHVSSRASVYIGGTGIVLMDWTLHDFADSLPAQEPPRLARFSLSAVDSGARASFLETGVGTAALKLAAQLRRQSPQSPQDAAEQEACAALVRDAVRAAVEEDVSGSDDGCEVLYGRAGLLYALLFLRAQAQAARTGADADPTVTVRLLPVGQLCADNSVGALVHDIVARGREGARGYAQDLRARDRGGAPPLMWSWHGKRYLGGAHGVAGILQILVSAPPRIVGPYWDAIVGTVGWLLGVQQLSGNWPHKASREMRGGMEDETDPLIQWCHGAPAVLILLSTLITRFGAAAHSARPGPDAGPVLELQLERAARAALARGGQAVYERGLLRKGVGLCHGAAGSVYALLAVSDALDTDTEPADRPWLLRAAHLAQLAAAYERLTKRGEMSIPDRPDSLYEGVAGMCCAWAEVLRRIEGRRGAGRGMPGYSDLPFMME